MSHNSRFVIRRLFNTLLLIPALLFLSNVTLYGQYKYGLKPVTFQQYQKSVQVNPDKEFIVLEKFVPGVLLDIRYATSNNFTKQKIYTLAKAYARKPVAEALRRAQAELKPMG